MTQPETPLTERSRLSPFVLVGVVGVLAIAALVVREVASIREGEREIDRQMAELDRLQDGDGAVLRNLEGEEEPLGVVHVRLVEAQRQGPGVEGRYHLDVGRMRWALGLPPATADADAWTAWAEASRPRWAALARSLQELVESGVSVRAEVFAPWRDAPDALPEPLLLRLLPILAAAGIVEVDVEHAPPALLEQE